MNPCLMHASMEKQVLNKSTIKIYKTIDVTTQYKTFKQRQKQILKMDKET